MTPLLLTLMVIPLDPSGFKHVTFEGKTPTVYAADGGALRMTVKSSASFLLLPFKQAQPVKSVRFEWRADGALSVKDGAAQKTKGGDDALVRIGLLVAGDPPFVPFFAPAWIKATKDFMQLPAGRIQFLVAGGPSKPGDRWESPYGGDMKLTAVNSVPSASPWQAAAAPLPDAPSLVGLWIMADGDDSGSSFTAWIRRLTLD